MIGQIGIFLFGMTAVWLVNDPRPHIAKWGCVFGCLAQPFWYYEAIGHEQWGIVGCSLFYSYSWARGFYFNWIKPWRAA